MSVPYEALNLWLLSQQKAIVTLKIFELTKTAKNLNK